MEAAAEHTFSNFMTGPSNYFTHSAALNVASSPGDAYNPLFIHGGTSLGKTHLLKAIGHHVRGATPEANVVYTTAERIINEFITCIFGKKMPAFRSKYRHCDVLLVDDVQYFAPEHAKTQGELFHAFNDLHANQKQIVLAADVPPVEIRGLDARLRSRFEWGLLVDIQPPDLKLRAEIFRTKARTEGVALPDDVALFLAERCTRHVRQIEGCLKLLLARHRIEGRELSMALAQEIFARDPHTVSSHPAIPIIQKQTAATMGVSVADIVGKRRDKQATYARHIAIYMSRKLTPSSTTEIGRRFGSRDHTTVLHAIGRIESLLSTDGDLKAIVARIEGQLR